MGLLIGPQIISSNSVSDSVQLFNSDYEPHPAWNPLEINTSIWAIFYRNERVEQLQ